MRIATFLLLFIAVTFSFPSPLFAKSPSAAKGLELLLNKAYLPQAFDQETFDDVWESWEEPLRTQAAEATRNQRRILAYGRYGFIERENDPLHRPMQYVVDKEGQWTMNCLACHQGTVAGKMHPGIPNVQFDLETLTEDIRAAKLRLGKKLTDLDMGSIIMPLGTTVGTTNAVMFGVGLMHYRDDDLNLVRKAIPPRFIHHDHDAPAWWNVSFKERLYADNFAPRGHRALMQFLASKANGPEKFKEWEEDFFHIEAYINSLQPPKYPFSIDRKLAEQGREVFAQNCSECHGTYGRNQNYPERIIPWDVVQTDPVRYQALSPNHRQNYSRNWINEYGNAGQVIVDPEGYLAPPLNGIWASAPYFHNGSVPTLWHVLHPQQRPKIWIRTDNNNYDQNLVGLSVEELKKFPKDKLSSKLRRQYFDTSKFGKGSAGHDFPDLLSEQERSSLLEYLKTL